MIPTLTPKTRPRVSGSAGVAGGRCRHPGSAPPFQTAGIMVQTNVEWRNNFENRSSMLSGVMNNSGCAGVAGGRRGNTGRAPRRVDIDHGC